MFNDLVKSITKNKVKSDASNVVLYPISEYNLEGIKILIGNCLYWGTMNNNNVSIASIDPSIWLGDFLDNHWSKISWVSTSQSFSITKFNSSNTGILEKTYKSASITLNSEEEINEFFSQKWKKLVLYSLNKYANLSKMTTFYIIVYADITEKYEERDYFIDKILD